MIFIVMASTTSPSIAPSIRPRPPIRLAPPMSAAAIARTSFLTKQKVLTLQAFLFFYGVVSQTTWNSTRQNIPFLACMGVIAVADIEYFRNLKRNRQPQLLSTSN